MVQQNCIPLRQDAVQYISGIRVSEAASLQQAQIVSQGTGYLLRVRGKNDPDYRLAPLSLEAYGRIQAWSQATRLPAATSSPPLLAGVTAAPHLRR